MASQTDTKVAVIAGDVKLSEIEYAKVGINKAISLKTEKMTTEYAIHNARNLLKNATYDFMSCIR